MKSRLRVWLPCVVVLVCVGVLGSGRVGWGKAVSPVVSAGEISEIERILADIDKQLAGIEKEAETDDKSVRKHAGRLLEMNQLLDFVTKEAAQTLSSRKDLDSRIGDLRKRIEKLMGKLGHGADEAEEER